MWPNAYLEHLGRFSGHSSMRQNFHGFRSILVQPCPRSKTGYPEGALPPSVPGDIPNQCHWPSVGPVSPHCAHQVLQTASLLWFLQPHLPSSKAPIKPCLCDISVDHKLQASDRYCEHQNPTATLTDLPLGGALCLEEGSNNGEKRTNYNMEETDNSGEV